MKQHFIRFFYLFFVSLLIIGCEAESLYLKDTHHQSNRLSKTRLLKGNEAKDVLNHLNSKLQNSGGFTLSNSDTRFRTNGQSIDYNSILQVIDTLGIKNYTFRIVNHPSDDYKTFHNLVVTEKESELKLSTMKYVMEEQFAIAYNNGIKTFEEFQGKVISSPFSQPLEVANPCVELELEFPPISGGNNPGIGNPGFISPGSISLGGGSSNCSQLNISFECENCSTSYNDWQSFYNSNSCGFGKYDAIVVINYVVANCRLVAVPCNPDGSIAVFEPIDDDCNSFLERVKEVLNTEGGFVNDPADPGGATNKGICWPVWVENASNVLNVEPTIENLQALTDEQAKLIYKDKYWDKVRCDEINDGDLRYLLFDFHVNSGKNAVKVLKKTLNALGYNLTVNGTMDNSTITAINEYGDIKTLYNNYKVKRQEFYDSIIERSVQKYLEKKPNATQQQINSKTLKKFKKGWTNRVNKFINKTEQQLLDVNC